jgi:uroporphyrinogen III methyltransferase/synthase
MVMTAVAAQPLAGRTIIVTRAAAQAGTFAELLRARGASVVEAPTIVIEPPRSWTALDAALDGIDRFTWVIFTSVNGVAMVDRRLGEREQSWAAVASKRVAAIGPATAQALERRGVRVALVPAEYRAEALVAHLAPELRPGDAVLLPRAARTRDVLVRGLTGLGARVTEVAAYETRRVTDAAPALRDALAAGRIDVVTFTSSSTARHFAELFTPDERQRWFGRLTVASIGPITAATAASYGLATAVMPAEYTIPALARAIEAHFSERSR